MINKITAIKYVDLSEDRDNQFLVDKEEGQYLGHPDSVLLEDGTIYTFIPKGMGKVLL